MKIEKLTENKIRAIVDFTDLDVENNIDLLINNPFDNQNLFLHILNRAEKELNFYTDNCKLLIEAFLSIEDKIVFTITKFSELDSQHEKNKKRIILKKPIARKKHAVLNSSVGIYSFDSFESFCEYCSYINNFKLIDISTLAKNIRLYFYHNAYYLVLKDISKQIDVKIFNLNISEFAEIIPFSNNFLAKLSEYGKIIIRHNAILTSTKFFIN